MTANTATLLNCLMFQFYVSAKHYNIRAFFTSLKCAMCKIISYDLFVGYKVCFGIGWKVNDDRCSMEIREISDLVNGKRGRDCLCEKEHALLASRFMWRGTSLYPGSNFEAEEIAIAFTGSSEEIKVRLVGQRDVKIESVSDANSSMSVIEEFDHFHCGSLETSQFMMNAPTFFRNVVLLFVGHSSEAEASLLADVVNENIFFGLKKHDHSFIVSHKDDSLCVLAGREVMLVSDLGKVPGVIVKEMQFAFKNLHFWHSNMKFWIKLIP